MPSKKNYTGTDGGSATHLPLESIVLYLKSNGFSIKPDDYIEILKIVERFQPANLEEAVPLIAPLITTNEEEQVRFYSVFEKLHEDSAPLIQTTHETEERGNEKIKKKKKRILRIALLSLIPIVAFLIYWLFFRHQTIEDPLFVQIMEADSFGAKTAYEKGDTARFTFSSNTDEKATWSWDLGTGWNDSNKATVSIIAGDIGTRMIRVRVHGGEKNRQTKIDTSYFQVCENFPQISVTSNIEQLASIGDTLKLNASVNSENNIPRSSAWIINGDTIPTETPNRLVHPIDSVGPYQARFVSFVNGQPIDCARDTTLLFVVEDPNAKKFNLLVEQTGASFSPPKKIKPWLPWLLLFVSLVLFATARIIRYLKKKKKKAVNSAAEEVIQRQKENSNGKKPPFDIPIENREQQLVAAEPVMNDVFRYMRQRTKDEALVLDLSQTINTTIKAGGIPALVYSNKLRHNDYLILVDRTIAASQQVQLFEYLIRTFRNENISVDRFFYENRFTQFYNETYPQPLPVKRLTELYKDYTVIIIGNAHHLVYEAYPVIDQERLDELSDWENKAVLTPIPFKDWGINEKLIGENLILLPADAEGQLRLIKAINERLFQHRQYLSSIGSFYDAEEFDFKETGEIKKYLRDDDLFQWLCALAVYPKIRWEMIVEIGKDLLHANNCPEKLNYTNLLKLARIDWMNEGYFPEDTRIELLKQLTPANEVIARKTLIRLFENASVYFKDNYYFSQEKEMQELTNKFILYANDPTIYADTPGKNEEYKKARDQFEGLWKQNKVPDASLKEYLGGQADETWNTPIQKADKTVSADAYFERTYAMSKKWQRGLSFASALFLLLAGILLLGNKPIANSQWAGSMGISKHDSSQLYPINLAINALASCLFGYDDSTTIAGINGALMYDGEESSVRFEKNDTNSQSFIGQAMLSYKNINSGAVKLSLDFTYIKKTPTRIPGRTITDTLRETVLSDILLVKNTVLANITGCERPDSGSIIVRYNDPSKLDSINGFMSLLAGTDYPKARVIYGVFDGPSAVIYNKPGGKPIAEALSIITANYFKKNVVATPQFSEQQEQNKYDIYIHTDSAANPGSECTSVTLSQLPSYLTEIWTGLTNNRLLNINLAKKTIYYSTGGASTYGRYTIVEACLGDGTYKFILRGDKDYRISYLRNISGSSFGFSFCQAAYATLEEASNVSKSNCGLFETMRLYYPTNKNRIYVPVDGINYTNTETAKLQAFLKNVKADKNLSPDITYYINNLLYSGKDNQSRRDVQIRNNSVLEREFPENTMDNPFQGSPFDRDYIVVTAKSVNTPNNVDPTTPINIPNTNNPPVKPDSTAIICNQVFTSIANALRYADKVCRINLQRQQLTLIPKEIYSFKNLSELNISYNSIPQSEIDNFKKLMPNCKLIADGQTVIGESTSWEDIIQFAPNSTRIDDKALAVLRQIGAVLEKYPGSSVQFISYYGVSRDEKIASARISAVTNALKKYGKFSSNRVQTQTLLDQSYQQNQQSQPNINYIKIIYTQFPPRVLGPQRGN